MVAWRYGRSLHKLNFVSHSCVALTLRYRIERSKRYSVSILSHAFSSLYCLTRNSYLNIRQCKCNFIITRKTFLAKKLYHAALNLFSVWNISSKFRVSLSHIYISNNLKNKENKQQAELKTKASYKPQSCMRYTTLAISLNSNMYAALYQVHETWHFTCPWSLTFKSFFSRALPFLTANQRNPRYCT